MELRDFCGRHIFSGCELRQEIVEGYINDMDATVCLFTLDGITYKAVEDPEDGYGVIARILRYQKYRLGTAFRELPSYAA